MDPTGYSRNPIVGELECNTLVRLGMYSIQTIDSSYMMSTEFTQVCWLYFLPSAFFSPNYGVILELVSGINMTYLVV